MCVYIKYNNIQHSSWIALPVTSISHHRIINAALPVGKDRRAPLHFLASSPLLHLLVTP